MEKPTSTSNVKVAYTGFRTDDQLFDASTNGVTLNLMNVIPGWSEGIQLFGEGGKGTLYIPSELAYGGDSRPPFIFPNTDLIFDIELIEIVPPLPTIEEYITNNNLITQTTASGLQYIIDVPGGADKPTSTSNVKVAYAGYRTDNTLFDGSVDGISFNLSGVIEGWTEGIQLFGEGGKGTLFIPSILAYGASSPSALIPANTDLIFDIELIEIE